MSSKYYLPQKTEKQLTQERLQHCKNLGLILDKYPPQSVIGNSSAKSPWFKQLIAENHIDTQLVESVYKRWQQAVKAMQAQSFTSSTDWRLVVGLGGETVLETDLTLHHIYGIPFIPGSALKGLTRAYVTGEIYKSQKMEEDGPEVQRVFGTQKSSGSVIFFDAMPTNSKISIDLDIMNSHYPKYYGEKKPPANNQDPNPVTFLTVTNTTFMFAIAPRSAGNTKDAEIAVKWLQEALQKYGVGGKTSAGYGFFNAPQGEIAAKQVEAKPEPYVRPNMPRFSAGQGMDRATTIATTDDLKRRVPEATAFLRYREFPTKDVLIVVDAEEAVSWTPGQTKNCLFVREEAREGCTVLFCQAAASKKKKR